MKTLYHYITFIVVLLTFISCSKKPEANMITIWEGSLNVDWHTDKSFDPELFDSLKAGDEIIIGIDYKGSEWPIVALFDDTHQGMTGAGRIPIESDTKEVSFSVTCDMSKTIHEGGLILSGEGYKATSVKIRQHDPIKNIEMATWFGHVKMKPEWKSIVTLSRKTFDHVDEGDVLRFIMSDVSDSACFRLYTTQWKDMPNSLVGLNGKKTFEYAINHEAIDNLHRDGLLVNGIGFTLERIEIKKPIWKGTEIINWNKHSFVKIEPEIFKDLELGDELLVCYGYIGDDEWPQIAFLDDNWDDIPGTGRTLLYSIMNNCSLHVTQEMLDHLQNKGMLITGVGYILKSICIAKGEAKPYMEGAKWIGEVKMTSDWNTSQGLSPACFNNAHVGDIMRLTISDVRNNAMISIRPYTTDHFDQMEARHVSPKTQTFDFELTENILTTIEKSAGCAVSGTGYTLNAMHIVKKGE